MSRFCHPREHRGPGTRYPSGMDKPVFVPLGDRHEPDVPAEAAARRLYHILKSRRSVRQFSDRPVTRETLEWLIRCAGTAPSGANKQPWRFVCVQDAKLKHEVRIAAEREEQAFYERRATKRWLEDLSRFGTDEHKEYIDVAPWLVVVFKQVKDEGGHPIYYPDESVGIACGLFLVAAHHAGLATLTHTPGPMGFLREVLGRPENERPYLLIPLGYPAEGCVVPEAALWRKPLDEIMIVDRGGT